MDLHILHTLNTLDTTLLLAIHRWVDAHPWLYSLAKIMRNPWVWTPLYLALFLWFWYRGGRKQALHWLAGTLLLFALSEILTVRILKPGIARVRPCHQPNLKEHLYQRGELCGGRYGFPSTHATTHFAFAMWWARWSVPKNLLPGWTAILWLIWATAIALSQAIVGVHFPGDLIAGALLGILLARLLEWGCQLSRKCSAS